MLCNAKGLMFCSWWVGLMLVEAYTPEQNAYSFLCVSDVQLLGRCTSIIFVGRHCNVLISSLLKTILIGLGDFVGLRWQVLCVILFNWNEFNNACLYHCPLSIRPLPTVARSANLLEQHYCTGRYVDHLEVALMIHVNILFMCCPVARALSLDFVDSQRWWLIL